MINIPTSSDSELNIGKITITDSTQASNKDLQLKYPLDPVSQKIITDLIPSTTPTITRKSSGGNSSGSINGLSTGTGVTSISANTPTLMEPTQVFANGITFNATGSDYGWTAVTAGQYIITALVGYTSTQSNSLYRGVIVWTQAGGGSPTWIVEVDDAGNGGVEICIPASIIYNLGVGDLVQLYTEAQYSGGSTVSSSASKTYLGIAKV